MFTIEQLEKILDAQEKLNVHYSGADWATKIPNTSILTAVFTELAEYFESAPRTGQKDTNGWKWWKPKVENDDQNSTIEIIDVLHFVLCILIKNKQNIPFTRCLAEFEDILPYRKDEDIFVGLHQEYVDFAQLTILFDSCDMPQDEKDELYLSLFVSAMLLMYYGAKAVKRTPEQIYDGYFLKNQLNFERVNGGYMTGDYKKIDENGQEDNRKLNV